MEAPTPLLPLRCTRPQHPCCHPTYPSPYPSPSPSSSPYPYPYPYPFGEGRGGEGRGREVGQKRMHEAPTPLLPVPFLLPYSPLREKEGCTRPQLRGGAA